MKNTYVSIKVLYTINYINYNIQYVYVPITFFFNFVVHKFYVTTIKKIDLWRGHALLLALP